MAKRQNAIVQHIIMLSNSLINLKYYTDNNAYSER